MAAAWEDPDSITIDYRGPGASALPALAEFMCGQVDGATLDEATAAVIAETGLSATTVWKAWLVLLDLDVLCPVNGWAPRTGRHRERHVWTGGEQS